MNSINNAFLKSQASVADRRLLGSAHCGSAALRGSEGKRGFY